MPEPIREAKIAEPASPLEYRSGRDDRKETGPAPELDGGAIRVLMFLIAIHIGLFAACIVHAVLLGLLSQIEHSYVIGLALHLLILLMECALVSKIGRSRETRTMFFNQGVLAGAILISGLLTVFLAFALWDEWRAR